MNELMTETGGPPSPPTPSPLRCRLRAKEVTGREGPIPYMGEVELENCSAGPLEIEYTMTPLQFFELVVTGPNSEVVSEGHFSDRFSPSLEPSVLRILPGEKFTSRVGLLATVPREKRLPGTYSVQASYCYRGNKVMAEPVTVEVAEPG
jgi:hypothetical protein